jgi:hypothetical protein
MALTIKEIPDTRQYLGINGIQATFIFVPGTSDYVTGGYVISAASLGLGHIWGADFLGANSGAAGTYFTFVLAQTNPPTPGLTSVNLFAYVSTTGLQVANGANLSGAIVTGQIMGY